jgi:hypothetical protein
MYDLDTVDGFRFHGTERTTIELDGTFHPGRIAIPQRLELELDAEGRARVRLFAFDVDELRITGVPLLRTSYAELLWRIAVRAGDTPAWWVIACDLGERVPRALARRYVRYPVRAQRVLVNRDRLRSDGESGTLSVAFGAPGSEEVAPEPRSLLVGERAEWEVPWGDEGTARLALATVESDSIADATLGAPVTWAAAALVRSGRQHRCGVARPR